MDKLLKIFLDIPNILTKWFLFLSSYIPLYILLIVANVNVDSGYLQGIIDLFESKFFWKILYCLIVFPIVFLPFLYFKKPNSRDNPVKYQSVEDNVISYIMTYITPLLTIDITENQDDRTILINIILFFIIGILYVKQDLVYLNPTFSLMGLNIFRDNDNERYIITRLTINDLEELRQLRKKMAIINITSNLIIVKKD